MTIAHADHSEGRGTSPDPFDSKLTILSSAISISIALSFLLPIIVFIAAGEGSRLHVVASLVALGIALTLIVLTSPFYLDALGALSILVFCTAISLSILTNLTQYSSETLFLAVGRSFNVFMYLLAGLIIGGSPRFRHSIARGMRTLAFLLSLVLIAGLMTKEVTNPFRPNPFDVHPNWWGEIAVATVMAAASYQSLAARSMLSFAPFAMALYVQSRGALIATLIYFLVGIILPYFLRVRSSITKYFLASCIALVPLLSVGILSAEPVFSRAARFFEFVFLFDSDYRGMQGSIGSRLATVIMGLKKGMENPLFGVGFGNSGLFDTGFDVAAIHNGIVMLFAELGIPGLLGLFLILAIFVSRWRYSFDGTTAIFIALLFMQQAPRFGANIAWSSIMLLWLGWFLGTSTALARMPDLAGPVQHRHGNVQ